MLPILDKLLDCAVPEKNKRAVSSLIANEKLHYIPPHHGKKILDGLWNLGQAIQKQQMLEIEYERIKEPNLVRRRVQPVGLMFSEYYFYLTAFLEDKANFENPDDNYPTIYRVDRSSLSKCWTSISTSPMPGALRRVSSAAGPIHVWRQAPANQVQIFWAVHRGCP